MSSVITCGLAGFYTNECFNNPQSASVLSQSQTVDNHVLMSISFVEMDIKLRMIFSYLPLYQNWVPLISILKAETVVLYLRSSLISFCLSACELSSLTTTSMIITMKVMLSCREENGCRFCFGDSAPQSMS